MKTLPEMLSQVVSQHADRPAIVDGETVIRYAALGNRIAALAEELDRRGVRPGDRVALLLPNGADFVISYFAVVVLGAIAVPLNEHYQQTELSHFLNECGASAVITAKPLALLCKAVQPVCCRSYQLILVEDQMATPRRSLRDISVETEPRAVVMYQFSSGSTGTPKRIGRTHANLVFELNSFVQTLKITHEDRFLGVAPFSHVNGLTRSMLACARAGATLYPLPTFERHTVAQVVERHRITVFIAVPFMFSILAQTHWERMPDFSSLRQCISASAPMPKEFNRQFCEKFRMYVRQLYGSTETGTISVNLSPDIERTLESVGLPLPGVEVKVFAEDGLAEAAEIGEVAVRSPAAITGYDGLNEVNRQVFRGGYFFTGDLGRKDAEGRLYLVGRKKLFINKGGYKIDPHEVEEVLKRHPNVGEVVVVGVPTAYGDEKVKAVVVPAGACTEEELVEHCRGQIAVFKIPSVIEFRDSLPRSAAGKILRMRLTEQ